MHLATRKWEFASPEGFLNQNYTVISERVRVAFFFLKGNQKKFVLPVSKVCLRVQFRLQVGSVCGPVISSK